MANERKIVKSVQFTAIRNYFAGLDENEVIGTVSVKDEQIPYTAGMAVELIDHEIGLLTKKNTPGKLTKTQEANMKLSEAVYDGMEMEKAYTVTDLIKSIPEVAGLNISKVRPLLTPLMDAGKVERTESKGRAYFTKVK